MSKRSAKEILENCVARIDAFDRECEENEHTDTWEAWDLLNSLRSDLESAAKTL